MAEDTAPQGNNDSDVTSQTPVYGTPDSNEEGGQEEVSTEEKSSAGAVIGILVIVLLIIIGGLYVWGQRLVDEAPEVEDGDSIDIEDDQVRTDLEIQSESTDLDDIEQDLNETDMENLDQDFTEIEAEL